MHRALYKHVIAYLKREIPPRLGEGVTVGRSYQSGQLMTGVSVLLHDVSLVARGWSDTGVGAQHYEHTLQVTVCDNKDKPSETDPVTLVHLLLQCDPFIKYMLEHGYSVYPASALRVTYETNSHNVQIESANFDLRVSYRPSLNLTRDPASIQGKIGDV